MFCETHMQMKARLKWKTCGKILFLMSVFCALIFFVSRAEWRVFFVLIPGLQLWCCTGWCLKTLVYVCNENSTTSQIMNNITLRKGGVRAVHCSTQLIFFVLISYSYLSMFHDKYEEILFFNSWKLYFLITFQRII